MPRIHSVTSNKITLVALTTLASMLYTVPAGRAEQQEQEVVSSASAGEETFDPSSMSPPDYVVDPKIKKWLRFQNLVDDWRRERGATSSITEMAMLPSYQSIIGMGADAIPLLIAQLKSEGDEPDQWFWALKAITGVNPIKPEDQGDFAKMAQTWVAWVENEDYAG